jgi:hypothetical protein
MASNTEIDPKAVSPIAVPLAKPLGIKPLEMNRLKLVCSSSSDIGNHFAAVLPSGVPFTNTLEPAFWSNHAPSLRVGDTVDVHSDDRLWFGRIYCRDVGKTRALMGKLDFVEFGALAQSNEPTSYRVKYAGLQMKWSVERVSDGKLVRDGFESQEAAELALKGMERSHAKVA